VNSANFIREDSTKGNASCNSCDIVLVQFSIFQVKTAKTLILQLHQCRCPVRAKPRRCAPKALPAVVLRFGASAAI
jgi:hypothetical protein